MKNKKRGGRVVPVTAEQRAYIKSHPHQAPELTAEILGLHQTTVTKKMRQMGMEMPGKYCGRGDEYYLARFFNEKIVPNLHRDAGGIEDA